MSSISRPPRDLRQSLDAPKPDAHLRVRVTPMPAAAAIGWDPAMILEAQGYEIDTDSLVRGDNGQPLAAFDMVISQAEYDRAKELADRQAAAADAPRISARKIDTIEDHETVQADVSDVETFMGYTGDEPETGGMAGPES